MVLECLTAGARSTQISKSALNQSFFLPSSLPLRAKVQTSLASRKIAHDACVLNKNDLAKRTKERRQRNDGKTDSHCRIRSSACPYGRNYSISAFDIRIHVSFWARVCTATAREALSASFSLWRNRFAWSDSPSVKAFCKCRLVIP